MVYTNCCMVYTIQKWVIPWGNLNLPDVNHDGGYISYVDHFWDYLDSDAAFKLTVGLKWRLATSDSDRGPWQSPRRRRCPPPAAVATV